MINQHQNLIEEDKIKSLLPDKVNMKEINKFMSKINEKIILRG